ncbi:MAG: hypothetical protein OSB43_15970 [Nocardioides sp.]|uniref:hypothetical protein n=1 Tax=Nocardioides sp. TaxID=35761 RepID=UPI002388553C|nr:hypothetical protein [Nocardioides sp.]MDE0777773.1 hypothetical protein [Nocardioides sp.]
MPDTPTPDSVLATYASLPARPAAAFADLSGDVVACGDDRLLETARRLGRELGRPVVDIDPADGWLWTGPAPSSVLVLALRDGFSAELARTWVTSSLRADVPLGLLLVEDLGDAEFQVAKLLLAHTRVLPGDDALVDAVSGMCGSVDHLAAARPERLGLVLDSPWRLLTIVGHSDLGHLGLGSCVVCGATGPERYAGRLLADGCDPASGRCRCTTAFLRTVVPAMSLRVVVLSLLGCMTFDPSRTELYSTNSLCAAALSGHAVAAIATLGDLDPHVDVAGLGARALADGLSLGAVVQRLNRAHRIPTGYGIALAGDPALVVAPREGPSVEPGLVADSCRARAQPLLDRCHDALRRSQWADRVHRDLLKVSVRSMGDDLEDALEALDRARGRIEDVAWAGVELLHEAVDHHVWHGPDQIMTRLGTALRRWDEAFVAAGRLVPGNDMFTALHSVHRLTDVVTEGTCPRCESGLSVFHHADPELAEVRRVAVRCWLCGPLRETSEGSVGLAVSVSGTFEPGAVVEPRLTITGGTAGRHRAGILSVVLHDRLTEEVLAETQAACTLAELPGVTLSVPAGTRSDLHVLWAMWVSEATVAFAATRVAVTRVAH